MLKEGDKVRLKKNIETGKTYGGVYLARGMEFDGERKIAWIDLNDDTFQLEGEEPWFYSEEMVELVEKSARTCKKGEIISAVDEVFRHDSPACKIVKHLADGNTLTTSILMIALAAALEEVIFDAE